jgi:anti-anti-sigma factor
MTVILPRCLDGADLEALRPVILATVLETTAGVVVLDAADVELISTAGLGLLVAAAMIGADRGIRLEVARPSALFRRSVALTGLGRHLGLTAEPALV